jgi:hypothetical protein
MNDSKMYLTAGDWSLLTSLTFGVSLVYLFVAIYGAMGGNDRFIRFDAPGVVEFDLEWPGTYVVYHEYPRTADSLGVMKAGRPEDLVARLQQQNSGAVIPLSAPSREYTFNIQRSRADGVFEFEVDAAGGYRFSSEFAEGKDEVPMRLVIIPSPAGRALRVFGVATVALCFAVLAILGLAYFLNSRRRRQRLAKAAAA